MSIHILNIFEIKTLTMLCSSLLFTTLEIYRVLHCYQHKQRKYQYQSYNFTFAHRLHFFQTSHRLNIASTSDMSIKLTVHLMLSVQYRQFRQHFSCNFSLRINPYFSFLSAIFFRLLMVAKININHIAFDC